jgi:hypothetical protein
VNHYSETPSTDVAEQQNMNKSRGAYKMMPYNYVDLRSRILFKEYEEVQREKSANSYIFQVGFLYQRYIVFVISFKTGNSQLIPHFNNNKMTPEIFPCSVQFHSGFLHKLAFRFLLFLACNFHKFPLI